MVTTADTDAGVFVPDDDPTTTTDPTVADSDGDNLLDLWTIQSITDTGGKGDTIIVKVPFEKGQLR